MSQLHTHGVTDIESLEAAHHTALGCRMVDTYPGTFRRRTGDDGVELLADARLQKQCSGGLGDLALDLVGVVLLLRAVCCECTQPRLVVRRSRAGQGCLEESLRDDVGVTSVGGGRVRVITERQPEMPLGRLPWALDDVLSSAEQLDDRKRHVRK